MALEVGQVAPDFTLTNQYGQKVTLSDFRGEKNVVVMFVRFGALNDSHPEKGRLEAEFIGSGKAYVATNGHTVTGRWVKTSLTGPTRFLDAKGRPIPLSPGQTFIQVMPTGAHVAIVDGTGPTQRSPAGHTSRPA